MEYINICYFNARSLVNDRKTRGGGVLIAIRNSLNATLISKSDHLEAVSIQLHLGNCLNVSLCCMYLPPGSGCDKLLTVVNHLSDILMDDNHLSNSNDIMIVGDFNLDWDTLGSTSHTSEMFCDFVFNNNLLQLVDQSTHTKGNILDLVLTNISHSIQNVSISLHNHFMESDHIILLPLI